MSVELQVSKVDARKEERILLACIMSTEYLNRMRKTIDLSLFTSKATKTIARWCLEYYDRYDAAPQQQLNTIF